MKNFIIALTVIVIVHYLFFLFGFSFIDGTNANFYMDNDLTLEEKGVFGDFTSGHFSILAFIWLAYGIYIQSKEFQLQREEFQNQTEQFKEQNKLYEQQMKELEIQSIQNQFDRKIAKLTEIEKNIANSKLANYDVYKFITECEQSSEFDEKFNKFDSLQKYIFLYNNLRDFVYLNQNKVNLEDELVILKKDIYTGLKISFLILLYNLSKPARTSDLPARSYYRNKFKKLKFFNYFEKSIAEFIPFERAVTEFTHRDLYNLYDVDIFEEIDPSNPLHVNLNPQQTFQKHSL